MHVPTPHVYAHALYLLSGFVNMAACKFAMTPDTHKRGAYEADLTLIADDSSYSIASGERSRKVFPKQPSKPVHM